MEALLDTVRMSAPSASSAPPPSATPVYGGDDGHRQRGQAGNDAAHRVAEADYVGRRLPRALLQVRARAERACSGAMHTVAC